MNAHYKINNMEFELKPYWDVCTVLQGYVESHPTLNWQIKPAIQKELVYLNGLINEFKVGNGKVGLDALENSIALMVLRLPNELPSNLIKNMYGARYQNQPEILRDLGYLK